MEIVIPEWQRGTVQKKEGGEVVEAEGNLGRKLTECGPDKVKIAIQTSWRTVFCILLDIMSWGGIAAIRQWGEVPPDMGLVLLDLALTIGFGLFPLIHLREYLAFYEYGIVYRKKAYLWSELGSAGWHERAYGALFYSTYMTTNKKKFNVTYVTKAKKQYNKAYLND